jgi:hypothetical protein
MGHRDNGAAASKKSAKGVSFEVIARAEPEPAQASPVEIEDIILDQAQFDRPALVTSVAKTGPAPLGPESRARLEVRLAELLELKQRLAKAQGRFL